MEKNADSQFNKMINTPVGKLIVSLAIPTVISMLVTSIYNMADTFFVSQINTQSSAAVGIVYPIMTIIQACGFTLGMGSGSLVSRRLGEKKNDEASETVLPYAKDYARYIFLGAPFMCVHLLFSTTKRMMILPAS